MSHVLGGILHADQGATYKLDNRTPKGTHPEANAVAQAVGWGGENNLTTGPEFFPLNVLFHSLSALWGSRRPRG